MTVYAVGDVQGCYCPLTCLLEQVSFDAAQDVLWFAGDLVNRGPESLSVLRLARSLGTSARVVLGNHEVHLLAVAEGARPLKNGDTLKQVLDAPDASELLGWLRTQPLLHHDEREGYCMVHAGIPPQWDLAAAKRFAREAEAWVRARGFGSVMAKASDAVVEMSPDLSPAQRAQLIVSAFTRMRVCTDKGRLDLSFKGAADTAPPGYRPWFAHPLRRTRSVRLIFGHWAALRGEVSADGVFGLDTGCVWGERLTLLRLHDQRRFSCDC